MIFELNKQMIDVADMTDTQRLVCMSDFRRTDLLNIIHKMADEIKQLRETLVAYDEYTETMEVLRNE